MEILVAVVAGLIAALVLWWSRSSSPGREGLKRLPGPWGLPIVGYIPFLTSKPYLKLTRLAKRYGSVFRVRLGSQNIVILNDFKSTKEAFSQDVFIGRPPESPFILNKETAETGAFFGLAWKEQRRFCLHMLRDLGLGKSKMEGHIQEEINELLERFEENAGKPFCSRALMDASMSNNIASLMFGKRFKYEDPTRELMARLRAESSKAGRQVAWFIFFPWLRKLFNFLNIESITKGDKVSLEFKSYIRKEIDEHYETFNPDNIRDFIDAYFVEMQKKNDPAFSKPVLEDLAGAFFGAGSETVRQSVEWSLLTAATHLGAQRRIQQEIKEEVGSNRPPNWLDHSNMPYTEAFISEVMRWRTLIPINLLRYTLADTELNGYFIPKHTQVLSNHWAIHHDPEFWGPDADDFRPERFLGDEGKQLRKLEQYVPFSIGKRACPGEPMAKVEIFLYFTSILQRFDVRLPEGREPDFEGELGIGLQIKPQDLVYTKRAF